MFDAVVQVVTEVFTQCGNHGWLGLGCAQRTVVLLSTTLGCTTSDSNIKVISYYGLVPLRETNKNDQIKPEQAQDITDLFNWCSSSP